MELAKSFRKLTPEERKREVKSKIIVELRAVEKERRQRVALENMERLERERATENLRRQREKTEEVKLRREAEQRKEARRANEQNDLEKMKQQQLKDERLHLDKVMQVEKECMHALKKAPQGRREEAELCRPLRAGGKAAPEHPTSDLKAKQQSVNKTLINNWVGENTHGSKPVKDKLPPNSTTFLLFAAKSAEETPKTPKHQKTLPHLQKTLSAEYWVEKCQKHIQKRDERRKLNAEEHHDRWAAFTESCGSSLSWQSDIAAYSN